MSKNISTSPTGKTENLTTNILPKTSNTESPANENPKKEDLKTKRVKSRAALADIMAPVKVPLVVGQILAIIAGILGVVPYIALVNLGFQLLQSGGPDVSGAQTTLKILIGAFLARLTIYTVALLITHLADVRLNRSIRERMITALGRAPLSWFSERTSGTVRKTMHEDVANLHVLVAHHPVDATMSIVMPLALTIYAFILDWRLGLLSIVAPLLYVAAYIVMMKTMGDQVLKLDAKLEKLSGTIIEFIDGISVVKAFGTVGKAHRRYADQAKETSDFYLAWVGPMLRMSALVHSIVSVPVVMLITFGGGILLVNAGFSTPIDVITVCLISLLLPQAIETFGRQMWGRQTAEAAAVRIHQVLTCEQLIAPEKSLEQPKNADIEFCDVSFWHGQLRALKWIDLKLPAGSVTALVGPSGSGKSTLATLVARFHDPKSGTVKIGGIDVRQLSETDLYNQVGFVLQDPQLLSASIADNIRLACPDASDLQVREAAKKAQILPLIDSLPKGFETVIGVDTNLSGGQAQRIAIARAILANRPILLLDEATAMTDPDCEAEIQRALNELTVNKTVIVIAHRPASIKGADLIVVLDRGTIVAKGTHNQLKDQPHYRSIWLQSQASNENGIPA